MPNGVAALYIRVSTVEQADEGYSLAAQEKALREYCDRNGYDVHSLYTDRGLSGKDVKHRPGVQALMRDMEQRAFDRVVVWKLTRLTRSLMDLCSMCDKMDKFGVSLISITEAFDVSTPAGRMMRNILGTVAQWEREVIGENVLSGMTERAEQGLRTCSRVLGYDVVKGGGMTVNEAEAATVRRIFCAYLQMQSFVDVVQWANAQGIRGKNGKKMSAQSIRVILTRPIYAGHYTFRGKQYRGDFEPIIDIASFVKVQRIIRTRGDKIGRHLKEPLSEMSFGC